MTMRASDRPPSDAGRRTDELLKAFHEEFHKLADPRIRDFIEGAAPVEEDVETLLRCFLMEKAVHDLGHELDNRPDWIVIPLRGIERLFGPSHAFGKVAHDSFYLDPAQIQQFSPAKVIQLLAATGNALAGLGHKIDVNSGIAAANKILKS